MLYVGRNAERRWNAVLPASSATSSKRTHGDQSTTAWPRFVDPAAAGAAGQLGVLARRQLLMVLAGELRQLLDHDRSRRHVDPDGQGLGGEHDLHEALDEALLDDLLHRRHHAGVVGGHADVELGDELCVAEHIEIGRLEAAETGRR